METLKNIRLAIYAGVILGVTPRQSYAAGQDLNGIITGVILPILSNIVIVIFAIALLWFVWAIAQYLKAGSKKDDFYKDAGMSILAMFVMICVWGLVRLLQNTFQLDNGAPNYPKFGN